MKDTTRRQFLNRVASIGGALAVYNACLILGIFSPSTYARSIALSQANGKKKVVILGGGIAGLAATYELERAGYDCVILEASHRLGGRNLTLRHGDLIDELGRPNYCNFDSAPNLYFNAGPARIPGHHRRVLHYCKLLKVPLRVKANNSRLAYVHEAESFGGRPHRQVEYMADARGLMAEIVWKATNNNILDQSLTAEDKEKLMDFARIHGDLTKTGAYKGSGRAGSVKDRMLEQVTPNTPMELKAFLDSKFWRDGLQHTELYDWAEPLMEAKGGMDNIVKGFTDAIESTVHLNAQVQAINLTDSGVDLTYQEKGKIRTLNADYCFNNIPAPLVAGISNNFSESYREGLAAIKRQDLFKISFQMKERFWEKEGIYGGITYTDEKIAQLWYPSHDIYAKRGVMLGAYTWNPKHCEYFANLSLQERLDVAAASGNKIHKNYSRYIEAGVSVPWSRMNHMMGCGNKMDEEGFKRYFSTLQLPEGRHYMIGDQISYHSGWQEGALASVESALQQFEQRVHAAT